MIAACCGFVVFLFWCFYFGFAWFGGDCVTVVWVDGFGSVCGLLRAVVVFWCFLLFGFWWLGV